MEVTYALGKYTAAALRTKPRDTASLRAQLLLGEPVMVLEQSPAGYSKVLIEERKLFIRTDQLQPVTHPIYKVQSEAPAFALDLFSTLMGERFGVPVTFGARLPAFDGLQLQHLGERFIYNGQAVRSEEVLPDANLLLRLARRWLFVPELAGGRTPVGVDRGAFIQLLMRLVGFSISDVPATMSESGTAVDFIVQCQEADLAFFGDRGRIDHVGILLPDSQVLHVSGRVRIDALDHFGIYDRESGRYSHRLRIVKRWLPDRPRQTVELRENVLDSAPAAGQSLLF